MKPLAWIGVALAGLYLYAQRAQAAPGGSVTLPGVGGVTLPGTGGVTLPGTTIPPTSGLGGPSITDAVIQEWFASQHALDPNVPYAQRVALINSTAAQYGITRQRIAAALGYQLAEVNNYLDGRLDYFRAG